MDAWRRHTQRFGLLWIAALGCGTHTSLPKAGDEERSVAVAGASAVQPSKPSAAGGAPAENSAAAAPTERAPEPKANEPGPSTPSTEMGNGAADPETFSFFVTSLEAMRELSGSQDGFGGDLRYGEQTGLAGADKICTEIAERSLAGSGKKIWRAFLSAKAGGPNGEVVHARDRIGTGPWYDRAGRLLAMNIDVLLTVRPAADSAIANDLPNERGEPNHGPPDIDNHDVVTASDAQGRYNDGVTCNDWTTTETVMKPVDSTMRRNGINHNGPAVGHSWPAQSGQSWVYAHSAPGCAPSVGLVQTGAGSGVGIGNGGGYGGIYCFAVAP